MNSTIRGDRRRLIAGAATAGAAGLAASMLGPARERTAPAASAAQRPAPRSSAYRETEHTRAYYRLARY